MSKLSPALTQLINAPFARPATTPAPKNIRGVFETIALEAQSKGVGQASWLALSTATSTTLNSPSSLLTLHSFTTSSQSQTATISTTEQMREIALKCIGFNGVPRVINVLGGFRAGLSPSILSSLTTQSSRTPTPQNITAINSRGQNLWKDIYTPFDRKLADKLAESHPDLPVHIIFGEYGALFSDPPIEERGTLGKVGRVLTSVVAIACLRAQTGVGPQVVSHVFGLRKAVESGSYKGDGLEERMGAEWLASDEGSMWLLESVDRIVEAIGEGEGSNFAKAGEKAKL